MLVCVHGNVAEYCKARNMIPVEEWKGELSEYRGETRVLVTDSDISKHEYYYLKGEFRTRGIELISTRHEDDEELSEYIKYFVARQKTGRLGRQPYGWCVRDGDVVAIPSRIAVAKKIIKLYDEGLSLRAICEDESIRHPDGRKFSVSMVHVIVKNRRKYEDE